MVDEYQDTNYIQEQLLTRLASEAGNLCVVGDEDQALYRFRGATVRNILEFPERFPGCTVIKLTTNYRSHAVVVDAYNRFMSSADWVNHWGAHRSGTTRRSSPTPARRSLSTRLSCPSGAPRARTRPNASLTSSRSSVTTDVIEDYSQVALLLHSVRTDHSGSYLDALDRHAIPYFCPRARAYFDNEEVTAMIGCLALILGYHGNAAGPSADEPSTSLPRTSTPPSSSSADGSAATTRSPSSSASS